MAECYIADAPNIATGAAKSVLVLTASSLRAFRPVLFGFSCDATTTGLMKVEFLVGTLSGGTTATAPNVARMNGEAWNVAPQTVATSYSAEPTYTKHASNGALAIKTQILPLPTGPFEIEYPLGREFYIPVSNLVAVRLTATTVTPNAYTSLAFEE